MTGGPHAQGPSGQWAGHFPLARPLASPLVSDGWVPSVSTCVFSPQSRVRDKKPPHASSPIPVKVNPSQSLPAPIRGGERRRRRWQFAGGHDGGACGRPRRPGGQAAACGRRRRSGHGGRAAAGGQAAARGAGGQAAARACRRRRRLGAAPAAPAARGAARAAPAARGATRAAPVAGGRGRIRRSSIFRVALLASVDDLEMEQGRRSVGQDWLELLHTVTRKTGRTKAQRWMTEPSMRWACSISSRRKSASGAASWILHGFFV
jgi:hypothetical protein